MSDGLPDGFQELTTVASYGFARYPAGTVVTRPKGWTDEQWEAFAEELRAACEEPDAAC